ncbi:MAG: EutN/CcmL family microcompartment protein [Planctomycetia bacterium]|nr:EutN/CcmL family microcompartment protein [Planctomycetia bacterium]
MLPAIIVGNATATVKHPSLSGQRLLIAQPVMLDGKSPEGYPQLVLDTLGARVGDRVILVSDGSLSIQTLRSKNAPARWSVFGIQDT